MHESPQERLKEILEIFIFFLEIYEKKIFIKYKKNFDKMKRFVQFSDKFSNILMNKLNLEYVVILLWIKSTFKSKFGKIFGKNFPPYKLINYNNTGPRYLNLEIEQLIIRCFSFKIPARNVLIFLKTANPLVAGEPNITRKLIAPLKLWLTS